MRSRTKNPATISFFAVSQSVMNAKYKVGDESPVPSHEKWGHTIT